MGFKNSVSLAQCVRRDMVRRTRENHGDVLRPENEIGKDRTFSSSADMHRLYLINFDSLEKMDNRAARLLQGGPSPSNLALRDEYEKWGVPLTPESCSTVFWRASLYEHV